MERIAAVFAFVATYDIGSIWGGLKAIRASEIGASVPDLPGKGPASPQHHCWFHVQPTGMVRAWVTSLSILMAQGWSVPLLGVVGEWGREREGVNEIWSQLRAGHSRPSSPASLQPWPNSKVTVRRSQCLSHGDVEGPESPGKNALIQGKVRYILETQLRVLILRPGPLLLGCWRKP